MSCQSSSAVLKLCLCEYHCNFFYFNFHGVAWCRKQLQQEFLDHGVLTLLKNWLEPLPDGSLPNINIRATVLRVLNDVCRSYSLNIPYAPEISRLIFVFSALQFPIDLEQFDRKEQLKKSGLGKVRVC